MKTSLKPLAAKDLRKLWPHQAAAVDFAIERINRGISPCLLRMPTGTGKSGVAACLTRLANGGTSLVLTPWAHLCDQMVADIKEEFWKKVSLTPNGTHVVPMLPSSAEKILNDARAKVIVATFATLNDLRLRHGDLYKLLASRLSLAIVDEGHYEPAVEWSKSVKGLDCDTVLLTATPYRNDLKLFRIEEPQDAVHHFTHAEAVAAKVIRDLRFINLDSSPNIDSLAVEFAKQWNSAKRRKTLASNTPRAIVCCSAATEIERAVAGLRKANLTAIGVHERFESSGNSHLVKNVADARASNAEIWVHQHKLTEGLDDYRFCAIALFTQLRNDRKLIQQIGRALRRGAGDSGAPALVFAPPVFDAEARWSAYLAFEQEIELLDPTHFRDVVDQLLHSQPPVEYFEGRFRRRFLPGDLASQPQVVIPPSVLVRVAAGDFSVDKYIEDCTDTLNTEDAVILGPNINGPCVRSSTYALWVYASVRNSRFLHSASLYEIKLATHCVVIAKGFVFVADSYGNYPVEYLEEHASELSPVELARFLDSRFRMTQASLDSSIPYDTVLRGADVRGHNLLGIPASLTDRLHICRSARGSAKGLGRRYVGMNNGRLRGEISERERRTYELARFVSWAKDVAQVLKSNVAVSPLFERYMPICAPPANPVPKAVSLDLVRLDLTLALSDGEECSLESSSATIETSKKAGQDSYKCSFKLESTKRRGLTITLRVEYQQAKRRFWFTKDSGAAVRVSVDDEDSASPVKTFADFLNQRNDLTLIGLDDGETVYQGRNFYKIDYGHAEKVLLELIVRPDNASICTTEKGSKREIELARASGARVFPSRSLFRAIVDRQAGLPFKDEVLICTDLGTECADFVAANPALRQLALIHAKAGSGRKISASAFHDVVAQAMKNLGYLTRNAETPRGVPTWHSGAGWARTQIPKICRTREDLPFREALWKRLNSDIINSSNPELYVVLVTTGCCDAAELSAAVHDRSKRTAEVAQLLHLLDGLNGAAKQLGIRLIVCDLPYAPPRPTAKAGTGRRGSSAATIGGS